MQECPNVMHTLIVGEYVVLHQFTIRSGYSALLATSTTTTVGTNWRAVYVNLDCVRRRVIDTWHFLCNLFKQLINVDWIFCTRLNEEDWWLHGRCFLPAFFRWNAIVFPCLFVKIWFRSNNDHLYSSWVYQAIHYVCDPRPHVRKRTLVRDVITEENSVCTAVVVVGEGSIPLLTSSVPKFQSNWGSYVEMGI